MVQFYARGAFASPAIGWCSSGDKSLLGHLQRGAWAVSAVLHSSLDWPVRRLSGGTYAMAAFVAARLVDSGHANRRKLLYVCSKGGHRALCIFGVYAELGGWCDAVRR